MTLFFIITTVAFAEAEIESAGDYYITQPGVTVRLGPDWKAKATNKLNKGEKVEVFEVKGDYARISKYYDGSVEGVSGKVARWVTTKYLSSTKPTTSKPSSSNSPVAQAVKDSDDFSIYQKQFVAASESLVKSGKCSLADFKEMGGWMKSTNHKSKPVYFTYCGGMSKSNKIYLDVNTGNTFR